MRIAVYAIAKNEAKFAERWMNSMLEADAVFVLDTGSTDGTQEILRRFGAVVVEQIYSPFRFDVARNASMALVPKEYDWCVCTDLDEVFTRGWRAELERTLKAADDAACFPNSAVCRFVTSWNDDGSPKDTMDFWKIHKNGSVVWKSPIHEYLEWRTERRKVWCDGFHLEHHPDTTKSREQYLPMLETAVFEDPCPRHLFYLGREYLYRGRPLAAIATLSQYLMHPNATFKEERAYAYRYIGRACRDAGEIQTAVRWYVASAREEDSLREGLVEYARMCKENGAVDEAIRALKCALERKARPRIFFTEDDCWDGTPERLLEEWTKSKGE